MFCCSAKRLMSAVAVSLRRPRRPGSPLTSTASSTRSGRGALDHRLARVAVPGVAKTHRESAVLALGDALVPDLLLPEQSAHVADVPEVRLPHRGIHVDFHQEVDPSAKIQAQGHRQGPEGLHPPRSGRSEVQRHHETPTIEKVAQRVLGAKLRFFLFEAQEQAPVVPFGANRRHAGPRQLVAHPSLELRVHRRPAGG